MKIRLSLIVPCYNVEEYVEKCIVSLENQDIPKEEYEILAYNDESKDNTLAILNRLAKTYPNVKVESHKNKGLSGTRNRGIREAKGEFLWFVDSDDWITENCLSDILSSVGQETDIMAFIGFIPEGGRTENSQCYKKSVVDKEGLFKTGFADAAQFYIFQREFLIENECLFKEGIKHEDTLFTPITLEKASKISFYLTPVYHFLQRPGSITTVADIKRIYDLWDNMKILYEYSKTIQDEVIKRGFHNHMAHHITEMLNYGIDNGKDGEELIAQIMKQHPEFWSIMRNAIDLKPRMLYWAVKLSPLPFVSTYRLLAHLR